MCTTLYRTKSFSTILKPLGSYTYAPKGLNYFYVRCSMVLISQGVRPCMVLNVLVRYWKFEYDTGSYNYDPNGTPYVYIQKGNINEHTKTDRLYLEVRYARDTSLSVPKTSDIFRLKQDYKNLPLHVYASNMKIYLSNVTSKTNVTLNDFNEALTHMSGWILNKCCT